MPIYIATYLIIINIIAFIVCACDKRAAIKGRRRISERSLFLLALIGGALGFFAAMLTHRHKIRKRRFMVLIPVIIALQAALLVYLFMVI